MSEIETTTRKGDLPQLLEMLNAQNDVRYDVVVSSSGLEMRRGNLLINEGTALITDDGVFTRDAELAPTPIFDEGVAHRFDIPMKYVRTMRARVPSDEADIEAGAAWSPEWDAWTLYDRNVNYWLKADPSRRHLVRGFLKHSIGSENDEVGIARAFLSDRFKPIDNYDVLLAALAGVRAAGVEVDIDGDISDRKMCVRMTSPEVREYAADLLDGYRSPFSGKEGSDNPCLFAGLVVKNSETGGGAFTIVPRLVVEVCSNGLQMTKDAVREVHLGGKLDEGVVKWSDETRRQELELVTARSRDAVATFLDIDYMREKIDELRMLAEVTIEQPVKALERVARKQNWTDAEQQDILTHFIAGGDTSALGVAQAVTAYAQTVTSSDRADDFESHALAAATLAVAG